MGVGVRVRQAADVPAGAQLAGRVRDLVARALSLPLGAGAGLLQGALQAEEHLVGAALAHLLGVHQLRALAHAALDGGVHGGRDVRRVALLLEERGQGLLVDAELLAVAGQQFQLQEVALHVTPFVPHE